MTSQKGIAPVAIVIAIFVVLVVAVGGLFASGVLQVPSGGNGWVAGGKSNEDRVNGAFASFVDNTSVDISADVNVKVAGGEGEEIQTEVRLTLEGLPLPANTKETHSMQGSFSVSGNMEGSEIKAAAEFRALPPKTFLRLNSLDIPAGGGQAAAMTSMIAGAAVNKWVYMEKGEESPIGDVGAMVTEFSPVDLPEDCEPTAEQKAAVETYLKGLKVTDFVSDLTAVGTEDGSTRFSMRPDVEKLHAIGDKVEELSGCEISNEERDEEGTSEIEKMEVLVNDKTGDLVGVDFAFTSHNEDKQADVSASIRFSNYDKAPSVEAPEGAISVEELMNQMMQQLFGGGMGAGMMGVTPPSMPSSSSNDAINDVVPGMGMEFNIQ